MIITINEKYRIITDEYNFMLQQRKIKKKGKNPGQEVWVTIGYYATIECAYNGAITHGLMREDLEGVKQVIDYLEKIHQEIIKYWRNNK